MAKEFPEQLANVGKKLMQKIPLVTQELLLMLDQAESVLYELSQDSSLAMQTLLSPYKKSLIQAQMLQYPDHDVKISALNCICELARITAPDMSYDDDQMKTIFKLMVNSMKSLSSDPSSRCYKKAFNILSTAAKTRLFVMMIDLKCYDLINEMFELFLTSITSSEVVPSAEVFEYMENIMTLLIEEIDEDDDISKGGLFSPLFACLDERNGKITPFGRRLGKKVIEKCSSKLLHLRGIKKEEI